MYNDWGAEFTWPCVAGCKMSSRRPVYRSARKAKHSVD